MTLSAYPLDAIKVDLDVMIREHQRVLDLHRLRLEDAKRAFDAATAQIAEATAVITAETEWVDAQESAISMIQGFGAVVLQPVPSAVP